jgi:hypothetical protein
MAQLNHLPVIANPLWYAQLAQLETHLGHWTALCSQLQHPVLDLSDKEVCSNFQATHERLPQQEDVPTWHHILLTETINVNRPLTWQEYQAAACRHMRDPVAHQAPAAPPQTTAEPDSASFSRKHSHRSHRHHDQRHRKPPPLTWTCHTEHRSQPALA